MAKVEFKQQSIGSQLAMSIIDDAEESFMAVVRGESGDHIKDWGLRTIKRCEGALQYADAMIDRYRTLLINMKNVTLPEPIVINKNETQTEE